MNTALRLTKNDTAFLKESRKDPITGDSFNIGDEVIFCAECKSAFLKESWEYMGKRHCNQSQTLYDFPSSKKLNLNSNFTFIKANESARSTAFLLDALIISLVVCFIQLFILVINPFWDTSLIVYLFLLLFTFRDNLAGSRSIGKMLCSLYIHTTKNEEKIKWFFAPIRNLIWIGLYLAYQLTNTNEYTLETILGFVIAITIYFFFVVLFEQTPLDKILKISVVERKLR